jgi:hypothetical protein
VVAAKLKSDNGETMKASRIALAVVTWLVAGCSGQATMDDHSGSPGAPSPEDPLAPCTDKAKCCTSADIVCTGDPDNNPSCHCSKLWDCSQNPKKCEQETPVPPGGGDWTCTWTETAYTCKGNPKSPPSGGGGWSCQFSDAEKKWICTASPPNPTNKPEGAGVWKCVVDDVAQKVVCERDGVPTPTPPPATKETNCADGIDNDGDGLVDCKDPDCACPPPSCPPGKECCDGKDNNGDGRIDEGNVCAGVGEPCPPGAFQSCDCYCGVHRKCRPDGTWGPCMVDGDGSCKAAKITAQSQCPAGFYCDYGECEFGGPFAGLFEQCKSHSDCPTGKVCDLGQCIDDMYFPCP